MASQRRRLGLATLAGGATLLVGAALVQLWSAPAERFWTDSESGLFDAAYRVPAAVVVAPEEEMRLTAVVTNTGEAAWNVGGSAGVRLGRHWLDPATNDVVSDEHEYSELGPLVPGAMTTVSALVRAPAHPGEYLLAWDAIQEPGIWLSERGVPVAITRVEVRTDPAGAGLPEAPPGEVVLYPDIPREPSRGELWRAAVAMVAERPALGVGPGTFRLRYGEYLGWQAWDERIHANNLYLELAATTGLLGLATFLFIVAYALARPLRNLIRPRRPASSSADGGWLLRAGLTAAVVALLAHGVVDYFLGFNPTIGLFWAVLGIGLGLALERPDQTTGRSRAAKTETGA